MRVEHVVPDQEQVTRKYGIVATPKTVLDTAAHRGAARFFVNASYPWPKIVLMALLVTYNR